MYERTTSDSLAAIASTLISGMEHDLLDRQDAGLMALIKELGQVATEWLGDDSGFSVDSDERV